MRIAVLSGKGGAGKTFVSVNLAVAASSAVYIDCDVEEPNGRLFLKGDVVNRNEVSVSLPSFIPDKCTGCRKCVDFCRFNALFFIKNKPEIIEEICHSCGGCSLVCPAGAVSETEKKVGIVEESRYGNVRTFTGILNIGEVSGVPVIQEALDEGFREGNEVTVIDCPPGSSCSVVEGVNSADYCILVAEPTAFGFHNFVMVHELVALLGKPCGVVINKSVEDFPELDEYCSKHQIPILAKIPYSGKAAETISKGGIASEHDENLKKMFRDILSRIGGESVL